MQLFMRWDHKLLLIYKWMWLEPKQAELRTQDKVNCEKLANAGSKR